MIEQFLNFLNLNKKTQSQIARIENFKQNNKYDDIAEIIDNKDNKYEVIEEIEILQEPNKEIEIKKQIIIEPINKQKAIKRQIINIQERSK